MSDLKHGVQIDRSENNERLDEFGRAHTEKLQAHARNLIATLYMMVRSVQLYDPDNDVFVKPLDGARDTINWILAAEGRCQIQTVRDSIYLNNMLVRMDLSSIENVRFLCQEMQRRGVGGFTVERAVSLQELRNFLAIFQPAQDREPAENGLEGMRLVSVKLSRYARIREKLEGAGEEADGERHQQGVDRKRYALTVYARGVIFLRAYYQGQREGRFLSQTKINRVVQDLTDVVCDHQTQFLGMTTLGNESEYLVFHSINTALMTLVFGQELGLDKVQLRELASTAMFHDAGMCTLPPGLLEKPGALSPPEKAEFRKAPVRSVEMILKDMGISKAALVRAVTTHEHKSEFGTAVRDARGEIGLVVPKGKLGVMARIIGICCVYDSLTSKRPFRDAYAPEIALTLMNTELKHKFDPEMLKVFLKVMAIQPVRVLSKKVAVREG